MPGLHATARCVWAGCGEGVLPFLPRLTCLAARPAAAQSGLRGNQGCRGKSRSGQVNSLGCRGQAWQGTAASATADGSCAHDTQCWTARPIIVQYSLPRESNVRYPCTKQRKKRRRRAVPCQNPVWRWAMPLLQLQAGAGGKRQSLGHKQARVSSGPPVCAPPCPQSGAARDAASTTSWRQPAHTTSSSRPTNRQTPAV